MNQMFDNSDYQLAAKRKKEHLACFLKSRNRNRNYFDDIMLFNHSLTDLKLDDIDASSVFMGKKIDYPIMINAVTGGFDGAYEINRSLAMLARKHNIPMAVGSQSIGIKFNQVESFKVVREIMENQLVMANLSALSSLDEVMRAIEMIEADAVQLHLNAPQELCMKEGDRDFRNVTENIEAIVKASPVPVVIKEVGFGVSAKTAQKLYDLGVRYIDVGGKGGTNFIEIEDLRNDSMDFSDLYSWGIPTPLSLRLCAAIGPDLNLIASGGVRQPADVVKALCLGSRLAGITGVLLEVLLDKGHEKAEAYLDQFLHKLRIVMMMIGAQNLNEIRDAEYKILGDLRALMADEYDRL